MGTPEENRAIVQDGLDKRKRKRAARLCDAEQEAITRQMIDIVNQNARNAKIKKQKEQTARKKRKLIKAKLQSIQKRNVNIATNIFIAAVLVFLTTILYITHLTQMWSTITTYVLLTIYTICGICQLSINATEITSLKKERQNV